jgi:hypothetical protein
MGTILPQHVVKMIDDHADKVTSEMTKECRALSVELKTDIAKIVRDNEKELMVVLLSWVMVFAALIINR